jgi:hypothetical protein
VIDHSNKRYDIVPFIGGLLCVAGGDALGRKSPHRRYTMSCSAELQKRHNFHGLAGVFENILFIDPPGLTNRFFAEALNELENGF